MLHPENSKKIGLCSDHAGFLLKQEIKRFLEQNGYETVDFGTHSQESCDYPDFAHPCAEAVERGDLSTAVALCGTGNGIAMTLNKHAKVRAAICWNTELAALARQHNDANILVLPARFIEPETALKIVATFLNTGFDGGRHQRRIDKIPL